MKQWYVFEGKSSDIPKLMRKRKKFDKSFFPELRDIKTCEIFWYDKPNQCVRMLDGFSSWTQHKTILGDSKKLKYSGLFELIE